MFKYDRSLYTQAVPYATYADSNFELGKNFFHIFGLFRIWDALNCNTQGQLVGEKRRAEIVRSDKSSL